MAPKPLHARGARRISEGAGGGRKAGNNKTAQTFAQLRRNDRARFGSKLYPHSITPNPTAWEISRKFRNDNM